MGKVFCSNCGEPYGISYSIHNGISKKFCYCRGKLKHNDCKNREMLDEKLIQKIGDVDYKDIDKVLINEDKSVEIIMKELPVEVTQFFKRAEKYNLLNKSV